MRIGIIIFAYNRSRHLGEVLSALRKNQGIDKLYIFQDGLKCEEHRSKWEKTTELIEAIDWCEVIYTRALYNKGLSQSIIEGINTVLTENDAIIVLEDDCVPAVSFISFMKQCFEEYEHNKKVYQISGYSWPIPLESSDSSDIYFCGRSSSWGWGTWKDRWEEYNKDFEIIRRIKSDKEKSEYLGQWGNDLPGMLTDYVMGNNDSWAVFWSLYIIDQGGYCINPYKSLINNIGWDLSGTHCNATDRYTVELMNEERQTFKLPKEISILNKTKTAFTSLHGRYTAVNEPSNEKDKIFVYGIGRFFAKYEEKINKDYYIEKFIDSHKTGFFLGKEIIKPNQIYKYDSYKILIMIQNIDECTKVSEELIGSYNISPHNIMIGEFIYGDKNESCTF